MDGRALLLIGAAALGLSAGRGAAEGGAIRGGEHGDFSRIVMEVDPTTEWSLETGGDFAIVSFPNKAIPFSAEGVFEKMPQTRIAGVRLEEGAATSRIVVDIACDCRVSTSFVGARYLALDVHDRAAGPETAVRGAPQQADAAPDAPPPPDASPPPDAPPPPGAASLAAGTVAPPQDAAAGADLPEGFQGPLRPEGPLAHLPSVADRQREENERAAVFSAEEVLLRQIKRAAGQGLISLAEDGESTEPVDTLSRSYPDFAATDVPRPPAPPSRNAAPPMMPLSSPAAPARPEDELTALLDEAQIEASTVYDRFSKRAAERLKSERAPLDCIADARLNVAEWSGTGDFSDQVGALRRRLVGEFDRVDLKALITLARLYVHHGFGLEAERLLNGFDVKTPDKTLLSELARTVEGRAVSAYGPLARSSACPGAHGLWLATGGAAPAFHSEAHFYTVQEAFSELPVGLRMLIAPRLIGNLLDAGRPLEARLIHDIVARLDLPPSPDFELAAARLTAIEGAPEAAITTMSRMVETNSTHSIEALTAMVRLALDEGVAIPERTLTDIEAALHIHRGTGREAPLRALLAETLAARQDLPAAMAGIREAIADLGHEEMYRALAVKVLAAAEPERSGDAIYAREVVEASDLIDETPENDPARETIARHLLALGLAGEAAEIVTPAAGRVAGARLVLAEAELARGETGTARTVLTGAEGPEAARLRARSFSLDGDYARAQSALRQAGLTEDAKEIAWESGEWPVAQQVAEDPDEAAMAEYMSAQTGAAEPRAASEAPGTLDAASAFVEPLPALEEPSLEAARRLLATGQKLEDFVQSLLTPAPGEP